MAESVSSLVERLTIHAETLELDAKRMGRGGWVTTYRAVAADLREAASRLSEQCIQTSDNFSRLSSPEGTANDLQGPARGAGSALQSQSEQSTGTYSPSSAPAATPAVDANAYADVLRWLKVDRDAIGAIHKIQNRVNAWREVGQEMARIIEYVDKDDLLPDWFEPRLRELLASPRVSAATPAPADKHDCQNWSHREGVKCGACGKILACPASVADDLDQCRQILAADMTCADGPLPEPKELLMPVARSLYAAINELRQLRRLSAAERPEQTWQPIESAPKDGTKFLAWMHDVAPHRAWQGEDQCGCAVALWTDHNGGGWVSYRLGTPTHWMPLPGRPQSVMAPEKNK